MKKLKTLLFILLIGLSITACKPRADYFKDGEAYYTRNVCVESHTETEMQMVPSVDGNGNVTMKTQQVTRTVCDRYEIKHYRIDDYECKDDIEYQRLKKSKKEKKIIDNPRK